MTKKSFNAADEALDEAAEAAELVLAERLTKEATTCDLSTLADVLEVADRLRTRRSRAEADARRQRALDALVARLPALIDQMLSMIPGAATTGAPGSPRA